MIKKNFLCIISIFTISYASEVTFIVDMSEETIETGNGNYPAVYLSGVDINGPSGLEMDDNCLLYTSPSPRDRQKSRMPSSA